MRATRRAPVGSLVVASLFNYSADDGPAVATERFLGDWPDEAWDRLLEFTEVRRFRQGELVIRAGDRDRSLFIVAEGALAVLGPKGKAIATIEEGSVVGEQVFADGQERSADVRALTAAVLLRIGMTNFESFAASEPELARAFLFDIARVLSMRLRTATREAARR
jgi:CRP/FNR family cyclic AMP-dependent transcriptional regulator